MKLPLSIHISHEQGSTNPRHQGSWTTKFCTLAHNICRSSILNLLHVLFWCLKFCGGFQTFGKFADPNPQVFNMLKLAATFDVHQLFKKPTGPQSKCTQTSVFILSICNLLDDTTGGFDYTASNGRIMSE